MYGRNCVLFLEDVGLSTIGAIHNHFIKHGEVAPFIAFPQLALFSFSLVRFGPTSR